MSDRHVARWRRSSPVPLVVFSASSVSTKTAAPSMAASSMAEPSITGTLPAAAAQQPTPVQDAPAASRRKHRPTRHSPTFPVQVRSMNDLKPGWTVERALGRLAQGYSVEHVSRLSGYAARFLRAQLR